MQSWEVSFHVPDGNDFETRFKEARTGSGVPQECLLDLQQAHDMAKALVEDRDYTTPYAVYLRGMHDYETEPASTVMVSIQNSV
jgi:hypothetical protein